MRWPSREHHIWPSKGSSARCSSWAACSSRVSPGGTACGLRRPMPTPAPGEPVAWPGRTACVLRRPMPIPAPGDLVDTDPCLARRKSVTDCVDGRRPQPIPSGCEGCPIRPALRHPAARFVTLSMDVPSPWDRWVPCQCTAPFSGGQANRRRQSPGVGHLLQLSCSASATMMPSGATAVAEPIAAFVLLQAHQGVRRHEPAGGQGRPRCLRQRT